MSEIRFVRVFVRQARSGDIPTGVRHLFVLNDDAPCPVVFYLSTMSVGSLYPEDFKLAKEDTLRPRWAKSVLKIMDDTTPKKPNPLLEDAIIRVRQYALKCAAVSRTRRRLRKRVAESTGVKTRRVRRRRV